MRSLKTGILGLAALVIAATTPITKAAETVWNADSSAGIYIRNTLDAGKIGGIIYSVNNNAGVFFESLKVFTANMLDQLYENTQTFGTFTGTKEEFLTQVGMGMSTSSEIQTGWSAVKDANGDVNWTHGIGFPGFDYDEFLNTAADSTSDIVCLDCVSPFV